MKVALLGDSGFVGSNVAEVLKENGVDYGSASRRTGVVLRDSRMALEYFEGASPDVVINCAAHVGSLNYVSTTAADVVTDNSRMILTMYEAIAAACPHAVVINPIANCAYPAQMETFREEDRWSGYPHRSVLAYAASAVGGR